MSKQKNNPRMTNPDGVYASEARNEDFFSLRDHFAGLAMQAIISASSDAINNGFGIEKNKISEDSYLIADAMLKQRENE